MQYRFADCVLDSVRHQLLRAQQPVPVEPLVFDLLHLLVREAGRLVTRDQMIEELWNGRVISESAISACIASARRAVGCDGKTQAIIRTIPRRGLQCVAEVAVMTPVSPDAAAQPPRLRFVRNDRGQSLAYAVSGTGPPCLYIGYMTTDIQADWQSSVFQPLFGAINAQNTLVRMDMIGTGQSDLDATLPGFDDMADDIRAVADAAGLERFTLFTQSGGCLPGIHFAARYPDRLAGMVINGGYAQGRARRTDPGGTEQIRGLIQEGWSKPESSYSVAFSLLYFPEGPLDLAQDIVGIMQRSRPLENMLALRDMTNSAFVGDLLGQVTCPTLVIHSRRDSVHPLSQARLLTAGIAGAELIVLETANHVALPGAAGWDSFIDALLGFLAR